jgi:hypothetical protein
MADEPAARVGRRAFLNLSTAGGLSLALAACTPTAPTGGSQPAAPPAGQSAAAPPPATAQSKPAAGAAAAPAKPAAGAKLSFPTYTPYKSTLKPDYHLDDPLYSDAYDTYPTTSFKAVTEAPGTGGIVNVLIPSYFPAPTPFEQNPPGRKSTSG